MTARASLQTAIKDPDAAQAKKLLAELEEVVRDLAPLLIEARVRLAHVFGEGRELQVAQAIYPTPVRIASTPLGRSFFPDAFRSVAALRRAVDDAKVIAAQVRELPGKV